MNERERRMLNRDTARPQRSAMLKLPFQLSRAKDRGVRH